MKDYRSQCYDNAAVMSGHISGVQQRIIDRNNLALFVNCDNHSLNLTGVHATSQDPLIVTFFGTIGSMYLVFSRSTLRRKEQKKAVPVTVKRESETRCSARAEAVDAIHNGITKTVDLLERMSDDTSGTHDTRAAAEQLLQSILTFNFLVLLPFWYEILKKIYRVPKRMQDPKNELS